MEEKIKIPIEVSARHVHLRQDDVDILFGKDYTLTPKKELSQKGYYVSAEKVEVHGSKNCANFSILLPLRKVTQIEVAISDAIKMGFDIHIRDSGDLDGSAPCILKGPKGSINLEQGVIVAARHIHLSPEYASKLGVENNSYMDVKVASDRELVYENVLVRVDPTFSISMHIDTDEANAANLCNNGQAYGYKI